jgi:transcriptional regulator with XRE-family HTH domain
MTAPAVLRHAPGLVLDPAALRRARRTAGLSLHAVGPRVDRAASVVARYEKGLVDPPASVLAALAGVYGVHPGEFFAPRT